MAQWVQPPSRPAPCESSNDGYNNNQAIFYDDEVNSSDSESTSDGKPKSKKRVPKCARCKNHGIRAKVKDHKDVCPKRFCICNKCIATSVRQREMKKQTAIRRKLVRQKKLIEKQKKIRNLKKPPTARANDSDEVATPELPSSNHNPIVSSAKSCAINVTKPTSLTSAPTAPNHELPLVLNLSAPDPEDNLKTNINDCNLTETEQTEILVGFSLRLMKRFGYSWEALSLIYVILKDTKKDFELAIKRIIEARHQVEETTLYKILKAGVSYYYSDDQVNHAADGLGKPTYCGRVPYVGVGDMDMFSNLASNSELPGPKTLQPDSPPKRPSSDPGVVFPTTAANLGFFPYHLGTPMMNAKVPVDPSNLLQKSSSYPEMASPPTSAGLGLFPYALSTNVTAAKVPVSPSSPREKPFSIPEMPSPPTSTSGISLLSYNLGTYVAAAAAAASAKASPTCSSSTHDRPAPPYLGLESPVAATTGLSFLPGYALGTPVMSSKATAVASNPASPLEESSSSTSSPYSGMAFPPASLFQYPATFAGPVKVPPVSPASPRERHSSYAGKLKGSTSLRRNGLFAISSQQSRIRYSPYSQLQHIHNGCKGTLESG